MKKTKNLVPALLVLALLTLVSLPYPLMPADFLPALLPLVLVEGPTRRERMLYGFPVGWGIAEVLLVGVRPFWVRWIPCVHAVLLFGVILMDGALAYAPLWRNTLHSRRRKICRQVSEVQSRQLMLTGMALLATLSAFVQPDERRWGSPVFIVLFAASAVASAAFAHWLIRCWLKRRPPVFCEQRIHADLQMLQEKESDARKVNALSDPARELFDRAVEMMRTKRSFLLYEFTLGDMAQRLYTNKMYLSRTINTFSGRGFRSFVNFFRIQYSIELFRDNMSLRVHTLAELSGFHSQVTYTTAFKLETGITPGEYYSRLIQGLDVPRLPPVPSIPQGE